MNIYVVFDIKWEKFVCAFSTLKSAQEYVNRFKDDKWFDMHIFLSVLDQPDSNRFVSIEELYELSVSKS